VFATLPHPLEVEQVGGSFWEGLIGPVLIALAAIFAAGLAAWVARRNHAQQLAHDRELRDLSHARQSLAAAVESIADAVDSVTKLSIAVSEANNRRQATDEIEASNDEFLTTFVRNGRELVDTRDEQMIEAESVPLLREENAAILKEQAAIKAETEAMQKTIEARDRWAPLMTRLLADTLRLRISIGNDSEVVVRHAKLVDAIASWAEKLRPDSDGRYRFDSDPSEEVKLVGEPMESFVEASQRWAADHGSGCIETP
jgi:hypothetical protein